jgi:putative lipoprotein
MAGISRGRDTASNSARTARRRLGAVIGAAALVLVALSACASTATNSAENSAAPAPSTSTSQQQLTGSADFTSKSALPSGAQLQVGVVDKSSANPATAILGTATVDASGKNAPIDFSIPYALSRVQPNDVYSMAATVTAGGKPLFVSKGNTLVLTQGQPSAGVAVVMKAP